MVAWHREHRGECAKCVEQFTGLTKFPFASTLREIAGHHNGIPTTRAGEGKRPIHMCPNKRVPAVDIGEVQDAHKRCA